MPKKGYIRDLQMLGFELIFPNSVIARVVGRYIDAAPVRIQAVKSLANM